MLSNLFTCVRTPLFHVNHDPIKEQFHLVPNRVWLAWCCTGWAVASIPIWAIGASPLIGLIVLGLASLMLIASIFFYNKYSDLRGTLYWSVCPPKTILLVSLWGAFVLVVLGLSTAVVTLFEESCFSWGLREIGLLNGIFVGASLILKWYGSNSSSLRVITLEQKFKQSKPDLGFRRRIIKQAAKRMPYPSIRWRSRDDFPQLILRWAYVDVFFLSSTNRSDSDVPHLKRQVFWLLGPIIVPFLGLLLIPTIAFPMVEIEMQEKFLFALSGAVIAWAAWSVAYYWHVGKVQLRRLIEPISPPSQINRFASIAPGRGAIKELSFFFSGSFLIVANAIFVGIVPVYLQIVSSFFK